MESVSLNPIHTILCSRFISSLIQEMSFKFEPFVHEFQIITEVNVLHRVWLDTMNKGKMLLNRIVRFNLNDFEFIESFLNTVII